MKHARLFICIGIWSMISLVLCILYLGSQFHHEGFYLFTQQVYLYLVLVVSGTVVLWALIITELYGKQKTIKRTLKNRKHTIRQYHLYHETIDPPEMNT